MADKSSIINILTYNLCWGCMKADSSSIHNKTAKTLAEKCSSLPNSSGRTKKRSHSCLENVALHIDASVPTGQNWDFVGTQESAKWDLLFRTSKQLSQMGYVHHLTNNGVVHLATFYNPNRWQLDAVKCGDLKYTPRTASTTKSAITELGRPYHVMFLTSKYTGAKVIVINIHNGHKGGKKRLMDNLSHNIKSAVSFADRKAIIKDKDLHLQPEVSIYNSVIKGHKWCVIMMGDFNDADNYMYYKGLTPFKYSGIPELAKLRVSSHGYAPPPTCCKPKQGDAVLRRGISKNPYPETNGDYILISGDMKYEIPTRIPTNNKQLGHSNQKIKYNSFIQPASDHLPAMAVVSID